MVNWLPGIIVIQPWISTRGSYAHHTNEPEEVRGYVRCQEESVLSPLARIQVERARISDRFVHLRFSHSNRYWERRGPGPNDHWIVATSDQPEEDTSKISCTLFEPSLGDAGRFYLTHVQSGGRVRVEMDETGRQPIRVYVDDRNLSDPFDFYTFRFVDWDTLVKMPPHVAFRGDNGKFLKVVWVRDGNWNDPYLQFSSDDGNDKEAAFELEFTHNGHVRIKSVSTGEHWWPSLQDWVWASGRGSATSRNNTWFWPVKVDGRTVALRSATNNFCRRLTSGSLSDYLNASAPNINTQARMVVSELVLDRSIYNVRYRMEDARVYDERPWVAGIGVAQNESDADASLTIRVAYEDTRSYSFTNSVSVAVGVSTSKRAGIPFIASGKISISAEVTTSLEWGRTTEETRTAEATFEVSVPPRSRARVNYVATHGRCNVPFSYTQRDRSSFDGQFITSQHTDGIFDGVNYYSFHFEQLAFEPLF